MARAYITISDFKAGLDSRRLEVAAEAGSLQVLTNAHINRGGEIEKAKKWSSKYSLPAGTYGLLGVSGSLYVFGSQSTPGGMPAGVSYQQLTNPDSSAMSAVVDQETFSGEAYIVARFADGTTHHFYDGECVTDWYVGLVRTSHGDYEGFLNELLTDMADDPVATGAVAGSVLTLTGIVDNDSFTVTGTKTHGGSFPDETITVAETQAAGASQPEIDTVTLGGTFDPGDKFTFTIDDNTYGASAVTGAVAATVITHKNKVYAGAGVNLHFSVVADATLWRDNTQDSTTNTGSGVIDMSAQASNDEDITGLGIYQNDLVILMRNSIQIWAVDPDPSNNSQVQVLDNTGTRSPRTVKSFGDIDLFYLSDSGYRSLRARYAADTASITDVGTPIDTLVIAHMATLTDAQIQAAVSEIEPQDGRYISALGDTQYVFSYFLSSKISAWSTYDANITFTDFAILNGRLYGRAGNTIYLLGGDDNDEYTTETVTVEFPYLDARGIATWKRWTGLDVILEGTWTIKVNTNPNQPDEWVTTAVVTSTSIGEMKLAMQQRSPVIKLQFTHTGDADELAKISKVVAHYETLEAA